MLTAADSTTRAALLAGFQLALASERQRGKRGQGRVVRGWAFSLSHGLSSSTGHLLHCHSCYPPAPPASSRNCWFHGQHFLPLCLPLNLRVVMPSGFCSVLDVSTFFTVFLKTTLASVKCPPLFLNPLGESIRVEFCVLLGPCLIQPPTYMELTF